MRTAALVLGAVALLAGALVACGSAGTSGDAGSSDFELVDQAYVEQHLADAAIVDVRTPEEYAQGHIDGAINIDSATFAPEQFAEAGLAPEDFIILYCRTGRRAQIVAGQLADKGYTSIKVYKPGYPEWSQSH